MGRSTDNKKNCTLIVRISPEMKDSLDKRASDADMGLSDFVRQCLEESNRKNNVIQKKVIREETYEDIADMCLKSMITTERFFDAVCSLFNDGRIYVEGFEVKTKGEYDLGYLLDVCHRANVDPQEMINKLANSLVRR